MKTMKKGNSIIRVKEDDQFEYLRRGYDYTSKSEWKEKVRSKIPKKEEVEEIDPTKPRPKRGKKSSKQE